MGRPQLLSRYIRIRSRGMFLYDGGKTIMIYLQLLGNGEWKCYYPKKNKEN